MAKIPFLAGLGIGFVLGARAGRERYESIKSAGSKVWQSGPVQKSVHSVEERASDLGREYGSIVTDKVAATVKSKVFGKDDSGAPRPTPPQPQP